MEEIKKLSALEIVIWAFFDYTPYKIDSVVRKLDRKLFKTDSEGGLVRQFLQAPGHSIILTFLFGLMVYFVIAGPTYDMFFASNAHPYLIFFTALGIFLGSKRFFGSSIYVLQLGIVSATAAWIVLYTLFIDPTSKESSSKVYTHIYLALGLILMILPLGAAIGLKPLFKSLDNEALKTRLADCLKNIELFEDRESKTKGVRVGFTLDRIFNSVMLAIFYNPILLFLLPSFMVLLIPERHDLWLGFYCSVGLALILLLYGRLRARWHMSIQLVERATTNGIPLAISVVVIFAAVGRLLNFSYVSIFLDGTRLTIWGFLLAFYSFAWIFEYWINRFLNERIISLFSASAKQTSYQLRYRYEGKNILKSDVELKRDRILQIHGGSRFLVRSIDASDIDLDRDSDEKKPQWFHSYTRDDFLERLLFIAQDQESYIANKKLLNIISRKIRIYFFSLNIICVLALVGFIVSQRTQSVAPLYANTPIAENVENNIVDCESYDPNATNAAFRLDCAIVNFADNKNVDADESGAAILVAASGGGTRAALHTASVLYGLRTQNLSENIVLMSGVSGGGVSAAYFSRHFELLNGSPQNVDCSESLTGNGFYDAEAFDKYPAWRCYFAAMSHPYIKDVVEGMAEWRILGDENNGRLLEESLNHRFSLLANQAVEASFDVEDQNQFSNLKSHGLILNSTITGHRLQESEELSRLYKQTSFEDSQQYYFTVFQGGRLALSNLADTGTLEFVSYANTDLALKYKALNMPGMSLATASAMTANFPPVFSDARICLSEDCNTVSAEHKTSDFFVTDGGATHNQGLISLLAATKAAVEKIPFCTPDNKKPLPRLHVIVAEASFSNFDYSQGGRGLGAALSAGYGLGNGIVGQQFEPLRKLYDEKFKSCNINVDDESLEKNPSILVHLMALPRMFRSRGGMGTHWMMPTGIQIAQPDQINKDEAERIDLNQEELEGYFASAYSSHVDLCAETEPESNHGRLCQALKADGSIPSSFTGNPTCTPWLRLEGYLNNRESCREADSSEPL